jgi:glyoxylase-like metal-dependent hydrolase (beta-lactamase superfamily II)
MYKLQFCSADTQEVLRETECDHPDHIFGLVKLAERSLEFDAYVLDRQQRLYDADYNSYSVIYDEHDTVFRVFFKVRLNDKEKLIIIH